MINPFKLGEISFELLSKEYEKDNYIIHNYSNNSKTCLIFFSSNGLYYPNTEEEFSKKIINENRYEWTNLAANSYYHTHASKIIFLRDVFKSFYISGINSRYDSIEKLLQFLKTQTEGYKIITAGSSAGAYASILYGCLLNASKIFAFSAIFDISSNVDNSYPILNQFKTDKNISKYYNLTDLIKSSNSKIFYYYPFYSELDKNQASYVQNISNVATISLDAKNHGEGLQPLNYQYVFFQKADKLIKKSSNLKVISNKNYFIKSAGLFKFLTCKIRHNFSLAILKIFLLAVTITGFFIFKHYKNDPGHIFDSISANGNITFSVLDGIDRYLVPGLLRNCDYDSIIVGNSLCSTTNAAILTEKTNESSINLIMTGSALYEQFKCIQLALKTKKIKTIYFCLDIGNFYYNQNYIRPGVIFPEYLYNSNSIYSRFGYLFDFRTSNFESSGKKTTNVRNFNAYSPEQFIKYKQDNNSFRNPSASDDFYIDDDYLPSLSENYNLNLLDFINCIKNIPDETKIVIYIPPQNMFAFVDIEIRDMLLLKKKIVEQLSDLNNVSFYDFQIDSDITENPDNFFDVVHFSPAIGSYIAENLIDYNKYSVDKNNIDSFNKLLIKQWKDFNKTHHNFKEVK
ncbi:MAG: hypothetical protein KBT21_11525 [Treponema sp.]|nr:hypothetical protein [Candidatus Treponema merdequi]